MTEVDSIQLNFNQNNIFIINISLAFIMFGVALGLTIDDFKRIIQDPKPVILGVISQFILLPFLTFLLVWIIGPAPSIALGMIMVAACPGGNISNFISSLSKGNAALSVSLTAIASILAIFMTPFNLSFYGGLYSPTAEILQKVRLSPLDVFRTIVIILGIPIVLGMLFRHYLPKLTQKVQPFMTVLSVIIFGAIVVLAFMANVDVFVNYFTLIVFIVLLHNAIALISGYQLGRLFRQNLPNKKSLSIETGIQNSGLGLLLIFTFFEGLGGMAIIAAWWGVWHIISGLSLGFFWKYRT